jgi:asparagine synthase (glutamine-hydrolysing)
MGVICGMLGRADAAVVRAMARALGHRGAATHTAEGPDFALASSSPIAEDACLVDGIPRARSGAPLLPAEVLEHAREAKDPRALELRGGYAAVLRPAAGGEWWLLRDRLGRRPLYYYQGPDYLLFSSELKGILATGLVKRALNLYSVDRMLALGCVPGGASIIDGVCRVRPGYAVHFGDGRFDEVPFSRFDRTMRDLSRNEAVDKLRGHLRQSVNRYETDALLWASGIDCAAVAAFRPQADPLFVVLDRAWQDEAKLARESARLLRIKLRMEPASRLTPEIFRRVARQLDEPVADASVFPLWLIAEQAAEHGTAFLSGFGADELLGGYPRYRFMQLTRGAKAVVPVNQLSGIMPALPPNAFVRRASHYLASLRDSMEAYLSLLSVFDSEERADLYTRRMHDALGERDAPLALVRDYFAGDDLTRNLLSLDLGVTLPDLLLTNCDRMASAHGVSFEFPYLDDDLVDFVVSLDPQVRYGVRSKPLLRLAMKHVLPGRVRLRAQRGFRMPQGGRVYGVIEDVARETLTRERVQGSGLFNWSHVQEIHRSANHNIYRRRQFWALLMFFAWYREVMEA